MNGYSRSLLTHKNGFHSSLCIEILPTRNTFFIYMNISFFQEQKLRILVKKKGANKCKHILTSFFEPGSFRNPIRTHNVTSKSFQTVNTRCLITSFVRYNSSRFLVLQNYFLLLKLNHMNIVDRDEQFSRILKVGYVFEILTTRREFRIYMLYLFRREVRFIECVGNKGPVFWNNSASIYKQTFEWHQHDRCSISVNCSQMQRKSSQP